MSSAAGPSSAAPKPLSCVLCQRRKVKCDRAVPCANCIKANAECVPAQPAPPRKRRPPNSALRDRLARCEALLQTYSPQGNAQHPQQAQPPHTAEQRPELLSAAMGAPEQEPLPSIDGGQGAVVRDEIGERYMESPILKEMCDELRRLRRMVDEEHAGDGDVLAPDMLGVESTIQADDLTLFTLDSLLPTASEALALWQLFMDRVDPLTKVIHAPSVQLIIARSDLSLPQRGLVFAIFAMAVVSLSEEECVAMFAQDRNAMMQRFNAGTKTALLAYDYLRNYNMVTVQTLHLYLYSFEARYDRHAAWVTSGLVVRMAYKLGYHRDGDMLGLEPFETEMRRRVWAQVVVQDTKFAFLSGLTMSSLPPRWDTKPPQNVNDADLVPGSTAPIVPRDGPTEMAFCHALYLVYRLRIQAEMDNDASALEAAMIGLTLDSNAQEPFDKMRAHVADLDEQLKALEDKYIDAAAGPVHRAALTIRPMLTHHLDDLVTPPREQQEWGTELFSWKDSLFKLLVISTESQVLAYDQFAACGFEWFPRLQLFPDFVAAIAGQLCQRPLGSLSDRAWTVVEKFYIQHRASLLDVTSKQVMLQAQMTLSAWDARVAEHEKRGRAPLDTPDFIHLVRKAIADEISRKEERKRVKADDWDLMQYFDMAAVDDFSENVVTNIYGL